jgi:cell division transport system ATP-binding protein
MQETREGGFPGKGSLSQLETAANRVRTYLEQGVRRTGARVWDLARQTVPVPVPDPDKVLVTHSASDRVPPEVRLRALFNSEGRPGAIHLSGISVGYGTKEIFTNYSLKIQPGTLNFLVGPSGSGKSTLLKLLFGTLKPASGIGWVDGIPLHTLHGWQVPRLRRRIGCVFQSFELLPHLTALQNVLLPLQLAHPRLHGPEGYATDALEMVGLTDSMSALATELSGGQQQRVAIARAIAHEPRILLADEPTGNLDMISTAEVMALFLQLNRLGSTVVISTHDETLIENHPGNVISLW